MCSGDSVRCSVVMVGGYVCSGDSVRCSVVMVGGYVCSGDSVRCSVVTVGGYVCSGDSVRCSVVMVGGYVCSGDSVRCSVVIVGGYVCRGDSECLYGGCGVVILRWCVGCAMGGQSRIKRMNGLTWFSLFQRVRIGKSSVAQVSRSNFPSMSSILVTTFSWEMT